MISQTNSEIKSFDYFIITFSSILIIVNILFIIPLFKNKTNCLQGNLVLICQFLLSYIFSNISVIANTLVQSNFTWNCNLLQTIKYFGSYPSVLSACCIILHSYFILTQNLCFLSHKKFIIGFCVLITWIFSAGWSLLYIFVLSDFSNTQCNFNSKKYYIIQVAFGMTIDLITIVICFILLYKICGLNAKHNEELQVSKKKTQCKLIIYIFGTVIGSFSKTIFVILMEVSNFKLADYYSSFLCLFNLLMIYIFVWTKQFKEYFLVLYLCKKIENLENKVNSTREEIILDDISYEENPSTSGEEIQE